VKRSEMRVDEYRDWIRLKACILRYHSPWSAPGRQRCSGVTEPAHVKTRGAFGPDLGNIVPLCTGHHRQLHCTGIQSFPALYDIRDLHHIAECLLEEWEKRPCTVLLPF